MPALGRIPAGVPIGQLDFGPYSKGGTWKWAARLMGGAVGWFLLLAVFQVFGGAFFFLAFGLLVSALMTFRTALAAQPHRGSAFPPGNIGFLIQDRVGDFVLTLLWRLVRTQTGAKFG